MYWRLQLLWQGLTPISVADHGSSYAWKALQHQQYQYRQGLSSNSTTPFTSTIWSWITNIRYHFRSSTTSGWRSGDYFLDVLSGRIWSCVHTSVNPRCDFSLLVVGSGCWMLGWCWSVRLILVDAAYKL